MSLPPAIVLAAGESSRFQPLSADRHKSLFRLGGRTILDRTLESLAGAGVEHAVVVESSRSQYARPEHAELPSDYYRTHPSPLRLSFVEQARAAGQHDAIQRAATGLEGWFFVVQPENVNAGELVVELWDHHEPGDQVVVAGQQRADYPLFAVLDSDGRRLTGIEEKPPRGESASRLCSMGIYLFHTDFLAVLDAVDDDRWAIIYAIERAAKAGHAAALATRLPFYPLKFPEHLWTFAELFGIDTACAGGGSDARCIVGEGCEIGGTRLENAILDEGVRVGPGSETVPGDEHERALVIGRRAAIGEGVRLKQGVRIGVDARIESGAEVSDSVPDGAVVRVSAE